MLKSLNLEMEMYEYIRLQTTKIREENYKIYFERLDYKPLQVRTVDIISKNNIQEILFIGGIQ